MSTDAQTGPLFGVRVVDLTTAVLGPVATQVLGDLGADVIKVESPQGDFMRQLGPQRHPGMAAYFLHINRNKRSVVLDLKASAQRAVLLELIASADVFVHNMRLSAAERLGLGYASMGERNPRLVHACASGFNRDGPMRDRPAYDDIIQGESGLAALNAGPDGAPRYLPMAMCDKLVGQALASAIGMALFARERTGRGQQVHVPMLETMLAFNLVDHLWHGVLDEPEKGLGYPRMFTPHRRPYATRDGYVCLMATTDEQWRRLLPALDRPELVEDPRFATVAARIANIDIVYGTITQAMHERSTAEWLQRLTEADVPHGVLHTLQDIIDDAYLWDTGFFRRVQHPTEGKMITTAPTMHFSATPASLRLPAPLLGQHTREVLTEIGKSAAEIDAICEPGAAACASG